MDHLADPTKYLEKINLVFNEYNTLFELPVVDFLSCKGYQKLPLEWQTLCEGNYYEDMEFKQDSFVDQLIEAVGTGVCNQDWPLDFKLLIEKSYNLSLQSWYQSSEFYDEKNLAPKVHYKFLQKMNPKKQHEVSLMSKLIGDISQHHDINYMVDIGAGQGYLTRLTRLQYNLNVLGIDGDPHQTSGARKLDTIHNNLQKMDSISQHETLILNFDKKHEFMDLVSQKGIKESYLICGLHTCGMLAYDLIHLFLQSDAKALVSVGCCYNKLLGKPTGNFPFHSKLLIEKGILLKRLGLKMACQTPFNWLNNKGNCFEFFKRHFYRALLQVILIEEGYIKLGEEVASIGKMSKPCYNNFKVYVVHALNKLNYPIITGDKIDYYYKQNIRYFKSLCLVWSCQALLAPLVESVLLLDRYCLLKENGLDVNLMPLFDLKISPRCFALVAIKK